MYESLLRDYLRLVFEAYAQATQAPASRVSLAAINDARWLGSQIAGEAPPGFNVRTFDKVMGWLSDHWPDEAAWPESVLRPSPKRTTSSHRKPPKATADAGA